MNVLFWCIEAGLALLGAFFLAALFWTWLLAGRTGCGSYFLWFFHLTCVRGESNPWPGACCEVELDAAGDVVVPGAGGTEE